MWKLMDMGKKLLKVLALQAVIVVLFLCAAVTSSVTWVTLERPAKLVETELKGEPVEPAPGKRQELKGQQVPGEPELSRPYGRNVPLLE